MEAVLVIVAGMCCVELYCLVAMLVRAFRQKSRIEAPLAPQEEQITEEMPQARWTPSRQ